VILVPYFSNYRYHLKAIPICPFPFQAIQVKKLTSASSSHNEDFKSNSFLFYLSRFVKHVPTFPKHFNTIYCTVFFAQTYAYLGRIFCLPFALINFDKLTHLLPLKGQCHRMVVEMSPWRSSLCLNLKIGHLKATVHRCKNWLSRFGAFCYDSATTSKQLWHIGQSPLEYSTVTAAICNGCTTIV
jgi:hypothetical protein